jgi:steroid 5-alpha reductase family enzyme
VLFICFLTDAGRFDAVDMLYIAVFTIWGVRLTLNWAIGWRGMAHQDWRYTMLHDKNPKVWFFTNFFGINMLPTVFVFVNMLPAYFCAYHGGGSLSVLSVLGFAVCLFAVMLQIVSDGQMRRFKHDTANSGRSIQSGLWKYSRHPNYLGEVSLWWGVWLIQAGTRPELWWSAVAPILMTLLFVLISIPMMENKLSETKKDYEAYQQRTSMLLLLPPRPIAAETDESVKGTLE